MINNDKWLDDYGDTLLVICKYIDLYINSIDKNKKTDPSPCSNLSCVSVYTIYYKYDFIRSPITIFHWLDDGTVSVSIDNLGIVLSTNEETSIYGNRMLEEYFYSFKNLILNTLILLMGGEIITNE